MARAHRPSGHNVGPPGCSSTCIVTKSSPKPIPGATKGFRKKVKFGNSIAFGKSTSQRIYPEQDTHKIG